MMSLVCLCDFSGKVRKLKNPVAPPKSVRSLAVRLRNFDWSEIDQSRSVGAETSYVPFFTPHHAWFESAGLIR